MLEKFDDRALYAVSLAQVEARRCEQDSVGTEHLLLGLIGDVDGIAAGALRQFGVTLDAAREQVRLMAGSNPPGTPEGDLAYTERARRALQQAHIESLRLSDGIVGPEHLLLGMLDSGDGLGIAALAQLGAMPAEVIQVVHRLLGQASPKVDPPQPEPSAAEVAHTTELLNQRPELRQVMATPVEVEVSRGRIAGLREVICNFCGAGPSGVAIFGGDGDAFICATCIAEAAAALNDRERVARGEMPGDETSSDNPPGDDQPRDDQPRDDSPYGPMWQVDSGESATVSRISPMTSWKVALQARDHVVTSYAALLRRPDDGRGWINILDADDLAAPWDELVAQLPIFEDASIRVTRVAFVSDVEARVSFVVSIGGVEAMELDGGSCQADGRWMATRDAIRSLISYVRTRQAVPPAPGPPPEFEPPPQD